MKEIDFSKPIQLVIPTIPPNEVEVTFVGVGRYFGQDVFLIRVDNFITDNTLIYYVDLFGRNVVNNHVQRLYEQPLIENVKEPPTMVNLQVGIDENDVYIAPNYERVYRSPDEYVLRAISSFDLSRMTHQIKFSVDADGNVKVESFEPIE